MLKLFGWIHFNWTNLIFFIFFKTRGNSREASLQPSSNIPQKQNPEPAKSIPKSGLPIGDRHLTRTGDSDRVPHSVPLELSCEDLHTEDPELGSGGVDATALSSAIGEREEGEGQEEVDVSVGRRSTDKSVSPVLVGTVAVTKESLRSRTSRNDSTRTLINEDVSKQFETRWLKSFYVYNLCNYGKIILCANYFEIYKHASNRNLKFFEMCAGD